MSRNTASNKIKHRTQFSQIGETKTVFFFFSQKSSPGHGYSQSEISSCADVVIRDGSGVMDDRVGRFRRGMKVLQLWKDGIIYVVI